MLKTNFVRTVGVAGSLSRIGTTTQAVQLVKYLKLMGYQACYIEVNNHKYLDKITKFYCDIKKEKTCLNYGDVELYARNQISEIQKGNYDYLVKDYGSYGEPEFEQISFAEQDIKIFVCGTKPNELEQAQDVIMRYYQEEIGYIFSFVPNEDRAGIKEMMEGKNEMTYFADYTPDPFEYMSNSNNNCKGLLHLAGGQ